MIATNETARVRFPGKSLQKVMTSKLHYPLTEAEWLNVWDELKPAEIKVLFYLRTLNPWGDRNLEVRVTQIATTLKLNKSTVSRALVRLKQLGYISLQIETAIVRLTSKALPEQASDNQKQECCLQTTPLSTGNGDDRYATEMIATQRERSLRNNRTMKGMVRKTFTPPHTYSDFKQTNSHSLSAAEKNERGEEIALEESQSEPQPNSTHIEQSSPVNSAQQEPEPAHDDKCSVDFSSAAKNSVERFDDRMRGVNYPWNQGSKVDPVFAEFVGYQLPRSAMHPKVKGRNFVINSERSGDLRKLWGYWEDYQLDQRRRSENQQLITSVNPATASRNVDPELSKRMKAEIGEQLRRAVNARK